jgi:hypothetical protein
MFREEKEAKSQKEKIANKSFEWGTVQIFGNDRTNQSYKQEKIKSRLNSSNVSCYSVQTVFPLAV